MPPFGKKSETVRGAHARIEEEHADPAISDRRIHSTEEAPFRGGDSARMTNGVAGMAQAGQSTQSFPTAPKKKEKRWRALFVVALIVFLAALIGLGAIIYQYWAQQRAYSDLEQYADLDTVALSDLTVDWDALRAINPDVVAWIYVPDTPINYPIVQGDDNEEYLHKAFDTSTGWLASAGTIFLDASNDPTFADQNNALYGHHMNDGSMFASVSDWSDNQKFNENRTIYVLTPAGNYRLKTFAYVKTTGSDPLVQTKFLTQVDYVNYIQDKLDRSVVSQEGEVFTAADVKQSFLLSTCEYSQNDGRAVVFAAVVETTVAGDTYLSKTDKGSTNVTGDEARILSQQYKEAA